MVVGTIACLLIPEQLMSLFTHTTTTIYTGKDALRIISGGLIISSISVTSAGALEGLGKGIQSLIISLCRYVVIIIPVAFILSRWLGARGVWHAFWVAETLTAVVALIVYRKSVTESPKG